MKKKFFMAATVAVAIISCSTQHEDLPYEHRNDFRQLRGEQIFTNHSFVYPQCIVSAADRILVCDAGSEGLMTVFSLENDSVLPLRLGSRGVGPHEFMNLRAISYNETDSVLYIHDTVRRKGSFYKFNAASPSFTDENFLKSIDFNGLLINDTEQLHNSVVSNMVSDPFMFAVVDDQARPIQRFGFYPGNVDGMSDSIKFFMEHQTILGSNPDNNHVVVAGYDCDWLAFYDLTDAPKLLKEYFSFEPSVIASEYGESKENISVKDGPDTKHAYAMISTTPKHVYAVYLGYTDEEREKGINQPPCILQFTWNGEFVEGFTLGEPFGAITVTPDDRYLIATTKSADDSIILKKFSLK